ANQTPKSSLNLPLQLPNPATWQNANYTTFGTGKLKVLV
ncbi:hypothetical protein GGP51_003295, partial [Salinibacter ruber]|nr:hypothetical protein [Salinibacter ruber]